MNVEKCANAHDAYLECTNYAITQLNLPNVAMYLDAGMLSPLSLYVISYSPIHRSCRMAGLARQHRPRGRAVRRSLQERVFPCCPPWTGN